MILVKFGGEHVRKFWISLYNELFKDEEVFISKESPPLHLMEWILPRLYGERELEPTNLKLTLIFLNLRVCTIKFLI